MSQKAYTLQPNGQVTIPLAIRRQLNIEAGDELVFAVEDERIIVQKREDRLLKRLDRIEQALNERGITLDELMAEGEIVRERLYQERYGNPD